MPYVIYNEETGNFSDVWRAVPPFPHVEITDEQDVGLHTGEFIWDAENLAVIPNPEWAEIQAERVAYDERETSLVNAITTLREWADDAESTTVTSGNAVAVLNTVVDRLGIFFDRFADLLENRGGRA